MDEIWIFSGTMLNFERSIERPVVGFGGCPTFFQQILILEKLFIMLLPVVWVDDQRRYDQKDIVQDNLYKWNQYIYLFIFIIFFFL